MGLYSRLEEQRVSIPTLKRFGHPSGKRETSVQFLFQRALCLDSVLFPASGVSVPLPEAVPWHLGALHHLVEQEHGSIFSSALREVLRVEGA